MHELMFQADVAKRNELASLAHSLYSIKVESLINAIHCTYY